MDLFDLTQPHSSTHRPLAERMRPRNLDEFIGQHHLVGNGKLLRKLIEADQVPSMILQGPPATGKTTLATIISALTSAEFIKLNAVLLAVAELKATLEKAKDNLKYFGKRTIVFIDEIHAMKSNVQMLLLQAVETGTFTLIGATTESVTHDIIPPLTSRCKVFNLQPLSAAEIKQIITYALLDAERGIGNSGLRIDEDALNYLADVCNGDVRSALNTLEAAAAALPNNNSISLETVEQAFAFRLNGISTTDFYDLISAFIKSMRGSKTDAALYWLARMLSSGVDPVFIARRMVIQAAEDVGLANPQALQIAITAKQAVEFIGMPEARIPLAEAVIYISESPKSNSAYKAINSALGLVKSTRPYPVPNQLKNSTGSYINPLDHPNSFLEYLPPELNNLKLYNPQNIGTEKGIYDKHNKTHR